MPAGRSGPGLRSAGAGRRRRARLTPSPGPAPIPAFGWYPEVYVLFLTARRRPAAGGVARVGHDARRLRRLARLLARLPPPGGADAVMLLVCRPGEGVEPTADRPRRCFELLRLAHDARGVAPGRRGPRRRPEVVLDGCPLTGPRRYASAAVGASCDLLVVGGGPAGAAAAIRGAAAGLSVVVCDKASFPRDKTCGDGLTTSALRLLERLGLDPATVDGWETVDEVVVRSPSGRVVELPLPTDGLFAAVAPRATLDAALLDVAARRGVEIRQGRRSKRSASQRRTASKRRLERRRVVTARYVVAADGMYSTVRRLTGVGRRPPRRVARLPAVLHRRRRPAPVGHLRTRPPAGLRLGLPGRPAAGPTSGSGSPAGPAISVRPMAAQWRDLLERPALRAAARRRRTRRATTGPGPSRPTSARAPLSSGRVLFVGDAAGATDPMTGEGIAQALLTGILAAEAVAAGGTDPAAVGRHYQAAVRPPPRPRRPLRRRPRRGSCARPPGPGQPSGPPASPPGPGATSPAGCSRTIPGPWSSRRPAGAGAPSPAPGAYRAA